MQFVTSTSSLKLSHQFICVLSPQPLASTVSLPLAPSMDANAMLIMGCKTGDVIAAQEALDIGANVNTLDGDNCTALMHSAHQGEADTDTDLAVIVNEHQHPRQHRH